MARTTAIGLDIGTSAVRAAELRFDGGGSARGGATLIGYGEVPLPDGVLRDGEVVDPAAVTLAIKKLREQSKFASKDVVIGVGNQRVVVREADLPWQPANQFKKSLSYHAEQLLPSAVGDAVYDFVPTDEYRNEDSRFISGLFVAAIREMVMANSSSVQNAGLNPVMVDLNAFAIQRALTQGELANYTIAFVDVGARITNLVIADKGTPRFVRVLPHGGLEATDALTSVLSTNKAHAEDLKREIGVGLPTSPDLAVAAESLLNVTTNLVQAIRSTFVYYGSKGHGNPIDGVVLTGGGTMLNGFGQYLASSVRLPVHVGNPLERIKVAKGVDLSAISGAEHLATTAIGLAYGVAR